MLRHRKILLLFSVATVIGSLSATLGYALHLRSDGYRKKLEARLSRQLGLRVEIGSVEPLSYRSRNLSDVRLWLPDRDTEVFRCGQALWRREPRSSGGAYSLKLEDGWLLTGENAWGPSEYAQMLRSGLGHDFAALNIRRIAIHHIDLRWRHPSFTWSADEASGEIVFAERGEGRATLTTRRLNSVDVGEPIKITAAFTPGDRLRFHSVRLVLPKVPLTAMKADTLLGSTVTQGEFNGEVDYGDRGDGPFIRFAGSVCDALLNELTQPLTGGPYDGRVDVLIDEATFAGGRLRTLRFSGRLSDALLGRIATALGIDSISGRLDVRVHSGTIEEGRVRYLSCEGTATGVPLSPLSALIGAGRLTGTLDAHIRSLVVIDDALAVADVTLQGVPPPGRPGTLDREVLASVSKRLWGFDATQLIPQHIERIVYTRLGVRLSLNGDELRIGGTHGPQGRTILTVRVFERELGVIKAPKRTYRVADPLGALREQLSRYRGRGFRRRVITPPPPGGESTAPEGAD